MADNYLEKRMEEHRSCQAGGTRTIIRRNKAGYVSINTEGHDSVLVTGYESAPEAVNTIVKVLRDAGYSVAFTCPDLKKGRELAQSTGAQHHHITDDTFARALDHIRTTKNLEPVIFRILPSSITIQNNGRTLILTADTTDGAPDAFLKRLIRLAPCLALPQVSELF